MYKMVLMAAVLSFAAFSFPKPATETELIFCDGIQLILKKMKTGETLIKKGDDLYNSIVEIKGIKGYVKDDTYGLTYNGVTESLMDSMPVKKTFAELKGQLKKCLSPKKIENDDEDYFTFYVGTIVVELSRQGPGLSDVYSVSLVIQKPKK